MSDERLAAACEAHYFIPETGNVVASDLALDLRDCRAALAACQDKLWKSEEQIEAERFIHRSCSPGDPTGVRNAARIRAAEKERDAALAMVAALREALDEDVADGENVPGMTEWLRKRKALLTDTAAAAAAYEQRIRKEVLANVMVNFNAERASWDAERDRLRALLVRARDDLKAWDIAFPERITTPELLADIERELETEAGNVTACAVQRIRREAMERAAEIAQTPPAKPTGHGWNSTQAEWIAAAIRAEAGRAEVAE